MLDATSCAHQKGCSAGTGSGPLKRSSNSACRSIIAAASERELGRAVPEEWARPMQR
jgi:hypothetical protein